MSRYAVLLEGRNFPLRFESETKLYGFYTTRSVTADSEAQAELVAVAEIREDENLISSIDQAFEAEPKIYMESVRKISWWSRSKKTGYTFYPMDSE
ncbi:hypothetical protein [uncultured Pseudoteredinibacter sp.]|uniref:hypothetical protein n=1 Tax=uncultured Pseudoteredinibacter sp. TaxID=1641701 RepID=UPI00262D81F7|nr:hypothetical protein [uncultured Pseudoteredinibacter sp.]